MNKKILIVIGITLIAVLIVLLLWKPKNRNGDSNIKIISPTITPGITRVASRTGADEPTRTPKADKAADQLSKLRLSAPIDTGDFIISMNWGEVIFEVKAKTGTVDKIKLWDWLRKNGYELISAENFKFIE